jgi:uncharacterized protein YcbK (DUF882 family)
MPSPEQRDRGSTSYFSGNLDSPFLQEEIFVTGTETEREGDLARLEVETPFQTAFEEGLTSLRPEAPEEEFAGEDQWRGEEDFATGEAQSQNEEVLSEPQYEDDTSYSEGEEEAIPEETAAPEEEPLISEEEWIEPEEEESVYPLEEAAYGEEESQLDEQSFIEPEQEDVDRQIPEAEKAAGIPAGREEITKVPLLRRHRGTGPDLILSWNDMAAQPQSVDVVVHLHGYSLSAGKLLNIARDIIPRSGLDWSDPEGHDRTTRRSRPTLALLPRGNFFGGKTNRGYSFPALVTETGLLQLIDFGLGHLARHIGATSLARGRLIITAHSGGGAALLRILRHNDPHEVQVFDGLYQDPAELVRWAKERIERDLKALDSGAESVERYMPQRGGSLCVLFRPGTATQRYSLTVHDALNAAIPSGSALNRCYRVEETAVGHVLIPRRYGWRLLANAAAELPGASRPRRTKATELYFEEEALTKLVFPSGESLSVLTGLPEGKEQDYWDPTGSGNPLLDTGAAHKNKKLSANFTVRELTTSGGVSADAARIDPKLVESLQRLRDHLGKNVRITSGYRSWKRNKQVYAGRKNPDGTPKKPTLSQHCGGRAADITVTGMNGLEIGKAAIDACGPNVGVGLGNTFAHIDVRGYAVAWNYGGVKDSWVAEVKRYQQAKGGARKPPAPAVAKPSQPSVVSPAAELVRFAQRVLNAAEREQLDDDGDLGRLTRAALERFRRKYNLGAGGILDAKTELALAQRALEEIAQQSLFARPGLRDASTDEALAAFKADRGLGSDPTLNAATRAALADALLRRKALSSAPPARASVPKASAPSSEPGEMPSRLGTLVFRPDTQPRFRYEFTPEDLLWTARLISGEAGARDDLENRAVIAAMLNRFAIFTHRVYPKFSSFLRAYSTPLQPVLLNKNVAQHYMNDPRFRRLGGTYEGTNIPRGQLQHHLDLQKTPWNRLRPLACKIAQEALTGQMPDTRIGIASEFASTWILYGRRVGAKNRTDVGWRDYTQKFKRDKRWRWIGDKPNLDQKRNAFFIDPRAVNLPPDSVRVVAPV